MSEPARTWLVTGGCGFIGVNLVRALSGRGEAVRVFDDLSGGDRASLGEVVKFVERSGPGALRAGEVELLMGDVRDRVSVRRAMAGAGVVVHLAAQTGVISSIENPLKDFEVNSLGLLNVLAAAKDAAAAHVVFASSNAPLGDGPSGADESTPARPVSPYGASKLSGEGYCSAFAGSYGLATTVLRFANAYGPFSRRKGSVVAHYAKGALAGEPLVIYGDGSQTRDFVHVDDLVQAISLAVDRSRPGELYQIASGRETTVLELARKIRALAIRDLGRPIEIVHEPARAGEVLRSGPRIDKARRELGYQPQVDFESGVEDVWNWYARGAVETRAPGGGRP